MRILKSNPYLSLFNTFLVDSPLPANINYFYGFGSLLGLVLVIQLVTGIFLAMHYTPNIEYAFNSVEHIMRDVNNGWLIRYAHANGASFFFLCVYIHIARGLYYGSFNKPRVELWSVGVTIFILMMAAAFLGYVLPWGQMSFWAACVITNFFSAIPYLGPDLVEFIWGGFSVDNPTLNRFFSLHFLIPFIIAALACAHLIALHLHGSNNPLGLNSNIDKLPFHPYFTSKDLVGFAIFGIIFSYFIFFQPNLLGHPDNYIEANPLVTPAHIVPEWYFLPFYGILRSIPNKLFGVITMFVAIVVLYILPFLPVSIIRSSYFRPIWTPFIWLFFFNFLLLGWIGSKPAEDPYILIGTLSTIYYFSSLLIIFPLITFIENILFFVSSNNNKRKLTS
uniref:Cytochrome b n=1 Tax=Nuclearia simplex TaxID=154970 RepID=M1K3K2_9EUKA|nr:cytochrome b [Nuclearia simplex]AGE93676.1 apocytochrome b [Nuclearia simplex]